MSLSVLGVDLSDIAATVQSEHRPAGGGRTIVCIPGVPQAAWALDAQIQAVKVLLGKSFKLICLDEAQGEGDMPASMDARLLEVLHDACARDEAVHLIGVDNLALVRSMTAAWKSMHSELATNKVLFERCIQLMLSAVTRSSVKAVAAYLRERIQHAMGQVDFTRYARVVLALEGERRIPLCLTSRRILQAMSLGDAAADISAVEAERAEITRRLRASYAYAVLSPAATGNFRTSLRDAEAIRSGDHSVPTPAGAVTLSGIARQARERIKSFLEAGSLGGLVCSVEEMIQVQADTERLGSSAEAQQIDREIRRLEALLKTTRLAAIDLGDYPRLNAMGAHFFLLSAFADKNFMTNIVQAWQGVEKDVDSALEDYEPERTLVRCIRWWKALWELARTELGPSEYEELLLHENEYRLSSIFESLSGLGCSIDPDLLSEAHRYDAAIGEYCHYYDAARDRAVAIGSGTVQAMEKLDVDKAVLLCLGFHLPTLTAIWRGLNVGFVVLQPNPPVGTTLSDLE